MFRLRDLVMVLVGLLIAYGVDLIFYGGQYSQPVIQALRELTRSIR